MAEKFGKERCVSVDIGAAVVVGKGKHLGQRGTVLSKQGGGWYKVQLDGVEGTANLRGGDLMTAVTSIDEEGQSLLSSPATTQADESRHSTRTPSPLRATKSNKVNNSPIVRRSPRGRSPSPLKKIPAKNEIGEGVGKPERRASPKRGSGLPPRHPLGVGGHMSTEFEAPRNEGDGQFVGVATDQASGGGGDEDRNGMSSEDTETDEDIATGERGPHKDAVGGSDEADKPGTDLVRYASPAGLRSRRGSTRRQKRSYGDSSSSSSDDEGIEDYVDGNYENNHDERTEQRGLYHDDDGTSERSAYINEASKQPEVTEHNGVESTEAEQRQESRESERKEASPPLLADERLTSPQNEKGKGKVAVTAEETPQAEQVAQMDMDVDSSISGDDNINNNDDEEDSGGEDDIDLDAMISLAAAAAREHTAKALRGMRASSPASAVKARAKRDALAVTEKRSPVVSSSSNKTVARKRQRGDKDGAGGRVRMLDSGLASPKYLQYSGKGGKGEVVTASVSSDAMDSKTAKLMAGSALYRGGDRAMLLERTKMPKDTTAGKGWFNMEEAEMTPELKRDLQVIRMRNYVDPKRFYKASDKVSKFLQIGTVKEGPGEFFSSRLTNKERKKTLVDEILVADEKFRAYSKSQSASIQQRKRAGGKAHYNELKRKRQGGGWKP